MKRNFGVKVEIKAYCSDPAVPVEKGVRIGSKECLNCLQKLRGEQNDICAIMVQAFQMVGATQHHLAQLRVPRREVINSKVKYEGVEVR